MSFDEGLESIDIVSSTPIPNDGEFISAILHYDDHDHNLVIIHYEGQDWVFTPKDWQSWLPETVEEIADIEWRVNDTDQMAIMFNGYPALSPF